MIKNYQIKFAAIPGYPNIVECICGQPLDRIDTEKMIVCPECGHEGLQEQAAGESDECL